MSTGPGRSGEGSHAASPGRVSSKISAIRAFFALAFDAQSRELLRERCAALRRRLNSDRIRWVPVENIHLTLRFLGQVEVAALPALMELVGEQVSEIAPFPGRVGVAGIFPSSRKPRAIALGVEPEEAFCRLAEAVERGVVASGFASESRRFRAHVTLARFRRGAECVSDLTFDASPIGIDVSEVVLYRSALSATGAIYTELARCELAGLETRPGTDATRA